jgi:hypothetical protein
LFRGSDFREDGRIELGDDADNIRIDPDARRVLVGYGNGAIATIDAVQRRKIAEFAVPAHPEGFQLDRNTNRIFVNVPKAGAIVVLDGQTGEQTATWPLKGVGGNFPMAFDEAAQRILVALRAPAKLGVFSTADGQSVGTFDLCGDADDVFVDGRRHRAYVSCGQGFIDVFDTGMPITAAWRIPTVPGARTAFFEPASNRLFLRCGRPPPNPPPSGSSVRALRTLDMMNDRNSCRQPRDDAGRLSSWLLFAALAGAATAAGSTAALAYRPFVGTDAAVADVNEVEIELQPAGRLRQDSQTSLIAPDVVFNYGFAKNWEFVFEGVGQFPLGNSDNNPSLAGVGAFLKYVVREGSLQDAKGPSIAVEFGPLLPGIHADEGVRCSLDTIVSQRWDWGTVHGNLQLPSPGTITPDVFLGAIVEGPFKWKVRPVMEIFTKRRSEQTTTISGGGSDMASHRQAEL